MNDREKNLVERLLDGGIDHSIPVTQLLRVAQLAASRLGIQDFDRYIESELKGYVLADPLPDYRILGGQLQWEYPGRGWSPVPGDYPYPFRGPISEVSSHAQARELFHCLSLPTEASAEARRIFRLNHTPPMRFMVSTSEFVGVVEGVRQSIFDWALNLDRAGIHGHGTEFTAEETEKARSLTINIFNAQVGGVAQGNSIIELIRQYGGQ